MKFDLEFFYWISGILLSVFLAYKGYKAMTKKIENVRVDQKGTKLTDVTGVDLELKDGDDIHVSDMAISQQAQEMTGVTGLSVKVSGKQSARLQGVTVEQPQTKVVISDDPNVEVGVNKQN